jgi:hypothetical protein
MLIKNHKIYEDFIDNISTKDVVISDMNDEKELIS